MAGGPWARLAKRGLVVLFIAGCRSPAPTVPPGTSPSAGAGDSDLFGPETIENILKSSPRTYRVSSGEAVAPIGVVDIVRRNEKGRARRMDPFIEVDRSGGKVRLHSHLPDEDVEPLFSAASDAFAARDFEQARRLYREAVEIRPSYFKSYTYLGNALYFLARYAEAQRVFEQALRLNPYDYQAHLFLGDTLHQLGHYDEAKRSLTHAFVLNRDNEVVQERLRGSLAKMGLALRDGRIEPRVRILPSVGDEVVIQLDKEEGERWYALAACLACWAYEDGCRERAPSDQDPLRIAMYRECLLNQAASVAARSEAGAPAADERILLAAIEDGFLEAIVFWEVLAKRAPAVMLLIPDELRADVLRYIERYVFVSTRMVRASPSEPPSYGSGEARLSRFGLVDFPQRKKHVLQP